MLIKVYTNRNTVKIITDVQDAEIYEGHPIYMGQDPNSSKAKPILDLTDVMLVARSVGSHFYDSGQVVTNECLQCFDDLPHSAERVELDDGQVAFMEYNPKFVDYMKEGSWTRLAICGYAYLCNDDGKTIAKIGC